VHAHCNSLSLSLSLSLSIQSWFANVYVHNGGSPPSPLTLIASSASGIWAQDSVQPRETLSVRLTDLYGRMCSVKFYYVHYFSLLTLAAPLTCRKIGNNLEFIHDMISLLSTNKLNNLSCYSILFHALHHSFSK
jgi:hypothetical protein